MDLGEHIADTGDARAESKAQLVLAALGALLLWYLWPFLMMLVGVYENVPDHSHGYFVPVVSGIIVYQLWPFRHEVPVRTNILGVPLFLFGLLLMTFGLWYEIALYPAGAGPEVIASGGLLLAIAGGALALFGFARVRFFAFPLLFLLLAVPYPDQVSRLLTVPMREMITTLAAESLRLTGYNVFREGNLLHLATVSLGVEDVCSGIRSLWASLAAAFAIGWFTNCRGWKLIPMVVMGILLAILQNLARIFTSAILADRYGEHWAEGWRHETLGIITLTLALFALLWFGLRIGRDEPVTRPADPNGITEWVDYLLGRRHTLAILVGSVLLVLAARYGIHHRYTQRDAYLALIESQRTSLQTFPDQLGPYRCVEREMPEVMEKQTRILNFTDHFYGTFIGPENTTFNVLVMYWDPLRIRRLRQWVYPHSPDVCFPSAGWSDVEKFPSDTALYDIEREWLLTRLYRKSGEGRIVYFWNTKTFSQHTPWRKPTYPERLQGVFESWRTPLEFMGVQYSIAIYLDSGSDEASGIQAAADFATRLKPALVPYGVGNFRPEDVRER